MYVINPKLSRSKSSEGDDNISLAESSDVVPHRRLHDRRQGGITFSELTISTSCDHHPAVYLRFDGLL
jgi:hypothetical protein